MDHEAVLNQALDLLADGEDRKALRLLQDGIADLKRGPDPAGELHRYYYWGRFLTAMEEYEQALLKFEKALHIDPDHEGSLWETASIFLHDLDRPEIARELLSLKLLRLFPAHPTYVEALHEADFLLRVRNAPPRAPGEAEDAPEGSDDLP